VISQRTYDLPWRQIQNPDVLGVEASRITQVNGPDVPGLTTDPLRPAGALRVQLKPYSLGLLDINVYATEDATAADAIIQVDAGGLLAPNVFAVNRRTQETVRVRSISGNIVTVWRGLDHSTAAPILAGDRFTVPSGDVNDSGGSGAAGYGSGSRRAYG